MKKNVNWEEYQEGNIVELEHENEERDCYTCQHWKWTDEGLRICGKWKCEYKAKGE